MSFARKPCSILDTVFGGAFANLEGLRTVAGRLTSSMALQLCEVPVSTWESRSSSGHNLPIAWCRWLLIACSHLIMNRCTLRQQQSQNFRLTSMVIRQQCSHKTATYSLKTRHPTRWQLWCARHPDFVARSSAAMSHLAHKATHLSASRDMQ